MTEKWPSYLLRLTVLSLIYFAAGKLGLRLAFVNASATAVWPPTGIALAACLLLGGQVWPAILVGAFLINVTTAGFIPTSIAIAIGNTLEAVVGAALVNRLAHGRRAFDHAEDIVNFTIFAALASPAISATVGVTSLAIGGLAAWPDFGSIWLTWWLGDVTGALIVAPLLVLWVSNPHVRWSRRQFAEAASLLAALVGLALIVFGGWTPLSPNNYPVEFVILPLVIWAAFRFGQREAITVTAVLSGVAIWGTLHGLGPFGRLPPSESLLLLQGYIGTAAITGLVLAALAADNVKLYETVQRQNANLEQRVQSGTSQLLQSERRLAEAQRLARLGSLHWDLATNTVTWSDELRRIYGVTALATPETFEQFLALLHPDDRDRVAHVVRRALDDHQPFVVEHRIVRPDGTLRTLHAQGQFIVDDAGRVLALSATSQDMTERKQIEDELRQSREQLRQLSAYLEHARDEERQRLARELHDELGSALTGLKMDVARIRRALPEKSDELADLSNGIDQAVRQVRSLATELHPAALETFGLVATLEAQVKDFQAHTGIACQFVSKFEQLDLDDDTNITVYRVVQESLTNIARHAGAKTVTVRLAQEQESLLLRVEDDGIGFVVSAGAQTRSLGLAGMHERVRALAGELEIDSVPGRGTTIAVRIPKPPAPASDSMSNE